MINSVEQLSECYRKGECQKHPNVKGPTEAALLTARDRELITAGLYLLECQADAEEMHPDMVSDFEKGGGLPKENEPRELWERIGS